MSISKKRKLYITLGIITILGVTAVWAFNILTKQKYRLNRRNIQMLEKEYEFEDVHFGRMKAKLPKDAESFRRGYEINDILIKNFPWPDSLEDLNNPESDYNKRYSQRYGGVGGNPPDGVKILEAPKRNYLGAPIDRPPGEPLDLTTKIGFLGNNDGRFTTEEDEYFVQKPNLLPMDELYDAVFDDHIQKEILNKSSDQTPLIVKKRSCFNERVKIVYFYRNIKDQTELTAHALLHLNNGYGIWFLTDTFSMYANLSIDSLENILKELIKSFIDIREQIIFKDDARHYFFMGNSAIILPFTPEETLTFYLSGHKLFDYLSFKTFYGANNTKGKRFFLNRLHSDSNKIIDMAFGLTSESLRDGERKVAGIDGEEMLIKITNNKSKNYDIAFRWRYLGDLEHQEINIDMEFPKNFPEKDLPMSIAMWDYILDSMVWFDKK